jgi:hypothetical protein
MNQVTKTIFLSAALALSTISAQASSTNKDFTVQALSTKADFAQNGSQDLLLRSDNNDQTYLYVEQQQGSTLAVFDVSDPAHIIFSGYTETGARKAYDFVTPIAGRYEMISFRDGSGTALLEFAKVKAPRLIAIKGNLSAPTEIFGNAGYLASTRPVTPVTSQPHIVQVVETAGTPRLFTTVAGVSKQVTRSETGTVFLLAEGKITVIRHLKTEQQYATQHAVWLRGN